MGNLEYRLFYRRHLPHIQPPGATLFLTFRLADSIPAEVLQQLLEESQRVETILENIPDSQERRRRAYLEQRRLFGKWDKALGTAQSGPFWLRNPRIAALVSESLHYRNGQVYDLHAFCIMPNHVHLVCMPLPKANGTYHAVSAIMHSLKRYAARQANQLLGREGAFWQHENYDHVVRDEAEWRRIITYVLNNPVAAGLVERWEDWEWSYCKHSL
ncbi:MAG: transposase [Chloroflexota bacterium]|nr:transposase [Chloroflexota bacterium]